MLLVVRVPRYPMLVCISIDTVRGPSVGDRVMLFDPDWDDALTGWRDAEPSKPWEGTVTAVRIEALPTGKRSIEIAGETRVEIIADDFPNGHWSVEEYKELVSSLGWDCDDLGVPQFRLQVPPDPTA